MEGVWLRFGVSHIPNDIRRNSVITYIKSINRLYGITYTYVSPVSELPALARGERYGVVTPANLIAAYRCRIEKGVVAAETNITALRIED